MSEESIRELLEHVRERLVEIDRKLVPLKEYVQAAEFRAGAGPQPVRSAARQRLDCASYLRVNRKRFEMSQAQLAEKLGDRVDQAVISLVENCRRPMPEWWRERLRGIFGEPPP